MDSSAVGRGHTFASALSPSHPVSPHYHAATDRGPAARVGLVMGYAALSPRQIEKGVRTLAEVVGGLRA